MNTGITGPWGQSDIACHGNFKTVEGELVLKTSEFSKKNRYLQFLIYDYLKTIAHDFITPQERSNDVILTMITS